MNAKIKIIQEHDGSWWFVVSYGSMNLSSQAFPVQYHELDYFHQEGIPIYPNR